MINPALAIVAVLSLILAAVMTAVAWTAKRDERRRAAARVAALAAAIRDRGDDVAGGAPPRVDTRTELFVEPAPNARFAVIGIVGVLAVAAVTGLVLMAESGSRGGGTGARGSRAGRPDVPLELVALEHDRDDSRLVVRGIVRNPSSGAALQHLTAVVLVFSKDGGFIASGRAPAAVTTLAAGAETPFVVTLSDADSVDRYRVSFRSGDRIVPHVDRRGRSARAHRE